MKDFHSLHRNFSFERARGDGQNPRPMTNEGPGATHRASDGPTIAYSAHLVAKDRPVMALVHSLGMLINLVILSYFVKVAGFAHQWVQLAAILVVALYVFLAMRWFVFPSRQAPRVAQT